MSTVKKSELKMIEVERTWGRCRGDIGEMWWRYSGDMGEIIGEI